MSKILITGSAGLVGSECAEYFCSKGYDVIGVDNDMRARFFGKEASTICNSELLQKKYKNYHHYSCDIVSERDMVIPFAHCNDIELIIHTAAQPSHDYATDHAELDFSVNAFGTLNLLELFRKHCPEGTFIFTSTNKVYGNLPNKLPCFEKETRWEIRRYHPYYSGIDETMSIDQCKHSLFGVSKASADLMVQEYGRYFGLNTACFRCGCLTGSRHSGVELHGFLSYLMKCAINKTTYTINGYKGKQVRDNLHSADLVEAFYKFYKNPKSGEVYNLGGGRENSCSILEAIKLCEEITGNKMKTEYDEKHRSGDHKWWISNNDKFKRQYGFELKYDLMAILTDIYEENK